MKLRDSKAFQKQERQKEKDWEDMKKLAANQRSSQAMRSSSIHLPRKMIQDDNPITRRGFYQIP